MMKNCLKFFGVTIVTSLFFFAATTFATEKKAPAVEEASTEIETTKQAEAMFLEARALLTGINGEMASARALILMQDSAKLGYPDAIGGLGYFYAMGIEVPKDLSKAADWFKKGAEKGSAKSKLNLALAIANGRGVPKDEKAGLELLDETAASGLPEAVYAQGETYYFGQFGRNVDMARAFPLILSAAKAGNRDAQNTVGMMYRDGLGTEKNEEEALKWLESAAKRGHLKAQSNLAHTLGLESQNRDRRMFALKWAMVAYNRKEPMVIKTLNERLPNLPPEEVAEAQRAAEDFKPEP